jgi:phosphomethylpyrimidine synthase
MCGPKFCSMKIHGHLKEAADRAACTVAEPQGPAQEPAAGGFPVLP